MKIKNSLFNSNFKILSVALFCLAFLSSCRGDKSTEPPIQLIQNMVEQTSYGPQSSNAFFKDSKATRPAVAGTVAQGEAHTNAPFYEGIEANSDTKNPHYVVQIPLQVTDKMIRRGQERYNIYCAPCHGYAANNDGLATQAAGGTIRPANLHDKEKIDLPVGRIYSAITNGVNNWNMPGFVEQMSVEDRWAVVAYVRALQLSKSAPSQEKK